MKELADYRSEFFGRLKQILGDRSDIKISGDHFIFQSEVLFAVNSAELSEQARVDLSVLAEALKEIMGEIPATSGLGPARRRTFRQAPISTPQFPSNLELSSARAVSVVKFPDRDGRAGKPAGGDRVWRSAAHRSGENGRGLCQEPAHRVQADQSLRPGPAAARLEASARSSRTGGWGANTGPARKRFTPSAPVNSTAVARPENSPPSSV